MDEGEARQRAALLGLWPGVWVGVVVAVIVLVGRELLDLWPWWVEAIGDDPGTQLTELVVPTFVGIATLAVAIVAIIVSRQTVTTAQQQLEEERERHRIEQRHQLRAFRSTLAAQVSAWFSERVKRHEFLEMMYATLDENTPKPARRERMLEAGNKQPDFQTSTDDLSRDLIIALEPELQLFLHETDRYLRKMTPSITDEGVSYAGWALRMARRNALNWRFSRALGFWAAADDEDRTPMSYFEALAAEAEEERIRLLQPEMITDGEFDGHPQNVL